MRTGRKARYPVFFKYVLPRDVTQGNCMTFNLSISSIRQFSINIILKYEKWEKERDLIIPSLPDQITIC